MRRKAREFELVQTEERVMLRRHALDRRCAAVLFSPVHGVMHPRELSEWILEDKLPVRLQLQIHKHIWGPEVRGV